MTEQLITNIDATLPLAGRRAARKAAGAHKNCPVWVVAGRSAPRVVGESYYWTTPSGKTRVHHPNAYGWRTRYWRSTLRVEVGAQWLARRGLCVLAVSP